MTTSFARQLSLNGPTVCESLSAADARARCRTLARSHYENFSVLSVLVPPQLRDDFAAVYAFCRWSDDLSDEVSEPERSRELLAWWRDELRQCFAGEPRHPVFVALRPTIERHDLPIEPFEGLIRAFEQDQTVTRYDTWEQLIGYCRGSADPVGRLVLMICGEPREEGLFALSDRICTALQLTNHWQDVKRDIDQRDRIYIPRELVRIDDFERRLRESARQGWAVDHTFLAESRELIRTCVERTWRLFEEGEPLLQQISPRIRPVIWLFVAGGKHILQRIEQWGFETVLHRPRLGRVTKSVLVARAWLASRRRHQPAPQPEAAP